MRNLILTLIREQIVDEGIVIDKAAFDEFGQRLFVVTDKRVFIEAVFDKQTRNLKIVTQKDLSQELLPEQALISLIVHRFNHKLILILLDGTIAQIDLHSYDFEIIGEQESGFLAAELSPCEELLVMATKNNSLILFDKDFNLIDEKPLDDGEGVKADELVLEQCGIAWRFDSNYFNVVYGSKEKGMKSLTKDKYLATFKSEAKADPDGKPGEVRSISEKLYPGVGCTVTWMPNGSLIMTHETVKGKQQKVKKRVIMWEKNGLRHGEFDLFTSTHLTTDEENVEVVDMKWNANSKVLAVEIIEKGSSYLLMYMRNNYKWYLKSKLALSSRSVFSSWSSKRKYEFLVVLGTGKCLQISFKMDFSVGSYLWKEKSRDGQKEREKEHTSLAAVVEGSSLLCTPLSKYVTAPPLAHFTVNLEGVVCDLCFKTDSIYAVVMKVSQEGKPEYSLQHMKYNFDTGVAAGDIKSVPLPAFPGFARLSSVGNKDGSWRCIAGTNPVTSWKVELSSAPEKVHFEEIKTAPGIVWRGVDGEPVYSSFKDQHGLPAEPGHITKVLEYKSADGSIHRLVLTEGQQLFWDGQAVLENCTSLCIEKEFDFLVCTSMTQGLFDQLHIHSLSDPSRAANALSRLPTTSTGKDHRVRNAERGSEIVSLSGQRLVFELPRGNLEVVYPKLLLFQELKRFIVEERDFLAAYKEIRRHKLDMNLIVDIAPAIFAEELSSGKLLKVFRKTDDINLVLNSLEKDLAGDLQYIYTAEELAQKKAESDGLIRSCGGQKVNYICSALRTAMMNEQDHFILSIIMTYTREQPPALEKALELVRSLQKDEDELCEVIVAPHLNPTTMKRERVKKDKLSSKEVLEYLSWVADAEHLYSVALGTFDLRLAVMVAETTQRDPKEYLPYIDQLRSIADPLDRGFKICLDTKQFDRAVSLLASGTQAQIDRAIAIIQEKKLFAEGIKAFSGKPQLSIVREMLGDDLMAKRDYKQAAHFFLANNSITKLLECYEKTLDWKAALEVLKRPENSAKKDTFLKTMKEEYITRKNYTEAAKILRHISDYTKAEYVTLIVDRGEDYRTLKKMYFDQSDPADLELIKTIILPKLDLGAEIMLTNFTTKMTEFSYRKNRLQVVQQMKKDNTFVPIGGDIKSGKFDNVSEMSYGSKATGGISLVTGASGLAGKKMKKPRNLKYRNIQENSPFEEEYLVEKLNEAKLEDDDVKSATTLIDCMLMFGQSAKCKELLELMSRYETAVQKTRGYYKTLRQQEFERAHPEVADIYSHLDDFLDANQLNNEKEKKKSALAEAIGKYWFIFN